MKKFLAEIAEKSTSQISGFRDEFIELMKESEQRTMHAMNAINNRFNSITIDDELNEEREIQTDQIMKEMEEATNIPKNLLPGISPIPGSCSMLPSTSQSLRFPPLRQQIVKPAVLPDRINPCGIKILEMKTNNQSFKATELLVSSITIIFPLLYIW